MNCSHWPLLLLLIPLAIACSALSPQARATCQDACLTNDNTVQDDDAVISNTSDLNNTTMGFVALDSDTTGSDNPLSTWIWRGTGRLATPHEGGHTATLLPTGMVLVAGGVDRHFSARAELYNPESGTWAATGSLNTARSSHTATLLSTGMVLVAGGVDSNGIASASAELYDPTNGTWTATGSLNTEREFHTATLLPNGMVLVAGGFDNSNVTASAELYDPTNGTWTATGSLHTEREFHTATLLQNGMVLVAGGKAYSHILSASAELGHRQR